MQAVAAALHITAVAQPQVELVLPAAEMEQAALVDRHLLKEVLQVQILDPAVVAVDTQVVLVVIAAALESS
jgi:hypothetical protein